jgi:hypothetical protein
LLFLWQTTMTFFPFLLFLVWRICFGCFLHTLWWMRIRYFCPINWDRGLLGWGSMLCCLPDVCWCRIPLGHTLDVSPLTRGGSCVLPNFCLFPWSGEGVTILKVLPSLQFRGSMIFPTRYRNLESNIFLHPLR